MPKRGYLRPLKLPKKGKLRPPKTPKRPSLVSLSMVQHADPVIKAALRLMFKNSKDKRDMEGRFIRRNNNVKDFVVFKSVDSFVNKPKIEPFMSM